MGERSRRHRGTAPRKESMHVCVCVVGNMHKGEAEQTEYIGMREERQLTFGPGNKENPCWAPNSTHLVFNSTDGPVSDLYVVNLNQPEVKKITHGTGKKHYPSWGVR